MESSIASSSNIVIPKKRRGGTGRKKITIQKIEKPEYRRVTFSKRRNGVFNRAKELVALCGAEVAVITFSQGGKVFGFANKSADAIVDRFLTQHSNNNEEEEEDYADAAAARKNHDVVQVGEGVDNNNTNVSGEEQVMKNHGDTDIGRMIKWLDRPISGMGIQELEQRKKTLETMIEKVRTRRLELDGRWLSL